MSGKATGIPAAVHQVVSLVDRGQLSCQKTSAVFVRLATLLSCEISSDFTGMWHSMTRRQRGREKESNPITNDHLLTSCRGCCVCVRDTECPARCSSLLAEHCGFLRDILRKRKREREHHEVSQRERERASCMSEQYTPLKKYCCFSRASTDLHYSTCRTELQFCFRC